VIDKQNVKKTAKLIGKLAITLGALYMVFNKVDFSALGGLLQKSSPALLVLAFLLFFLAKILEAFRSNYFFRAIGLKINEPTNVKLYFLGLFYNLFFPGGIGGDSYRVYWIKKRYEIKLKELIGSFLLNRISGLLALSSLLLISIVFLSIEIAYSYWFFALIPFAFLVYFGVLKKFFQRYLQTIVPTSILSFGIQLLSIASAHLLLVSLGITDSFGDYWFIYLLSGLAFIIPITIGGIGSRELVFLYGADFLAIDLNICIALSLLIYCMRVLSSLAGTYFLAFPDKISGQNP